MKRRLPPSGRLTRYRFLLYGLIALVLLAGLGASLLVQQAAGDIAESSREVLSPHQDRVEEALTEQALDAAAENRDNLAFLSRLVLIYTGIISLIALLVA